MFDLGPRACNQSPRCTCSGRATSEPIPGSNRELGQAEERVFANAATQAMGNVEVNDIMISPMLSKEDQGAGGDYDYDTNNHDHGSELKLSSKNTKSA